MWEMRLPKSSLCLQPFAVLNWNLVPGFERFGLERLPAHAKLPEDSISRPESISLSVSVWLSVCMSVCLSGSVWLCLSVCMYVHVHLCIAYACAARNICMYTYVERERTGDRENGRERESEREREREKEQKRESEKHVWTHDICLTQGWHNKC